MSKFDYEKSLNGAPVRTLEGDVVEQLTRFDGVEDGFELVGVVNGKIEVWDINGKYFNCGSPSLYDLEMSPVKRVKWGLYDKARGYIATEVFDFFESAKDMIDCGIYPKQTVVVKIEWEE